MDEGTTTMRRVSLRLPDNLAAAIELLADTEGISVNQLVTRILTERVREVREQDLEAKARVREQLEQLRREYGL